MFNYPNSGPLEAEQCDHQEIDTYPQLQDKPLTIEYSVTTVKSEERVKSVTSSTERLTNPAEQDGVMTNLRRATAAQQSILGQRQGKFIQI